MARRSAGAIAADASPVATDTTGAVSQLHIELKLPVLHPGQVAAYRVFQRNRLVVVRCGRRWGKTDLGKTIAGDGAIKGQSIGWFAPDYKVQMEAYNEIALMLEPVTRSSSKTEGVIRTMTGGRIDFWTLENERAGRSRKYHKVLCDEVAFTRPNMMQIWNTAIKPTLLDYGGKALMMSNTNGTDETNFMWQVCNQPLHGFVEYHAPTHQNPHLSREFVAKLIDENPPLVYQQEYLAEFVDWSGIQFFDIKKLLVNDLPIPFPSSCDAVFATIDTAVKDGMEHDSTAVTYWGVSRVPGMPLMILDWDIVQLEGSLLETWLPTVFQRLNELTKVCGARLGSLGAHIEDKQTGTILIQQATRRGWRAAAIDSKLTAAGKDGRAISVSGYVHRESVKFTDHAYNKITTHKTVTRNHLVSQVSNFRIGKKEGAADDLLDTFCYGIAIALGNEEGY